MLFLWVSLRTGSSCKTWPLLVLSTKKEDIEEDPCGGWSLVDFPFHQGLPADVPCRVNPPSIDCKIIICMAYSHVYSRGGLYSILLWKRQHIRFGPGTRFRKNVRAQHHLVTYLGSKILPKPPFRHSKDTSWLVYIVVWVLLYLFLVCHSLANAACYSLGVLPMGSKL